mgnify:CR=1 FL=1
MTPKTRERLKHIITTSERIDRDIETWIDRREQLVNGCVYITVRMPDEDSEWYPAGNTISAVLEYIDSKIKTLQAEQRNLQPPRRKR